MNRPPETRPQCGTQAGCNLHSKHGEGLCDDCRAFWRGYQQQRRRSKGENTRTLVPIELLRQAVEQCTGDVRAQLLAVLREPE